MIRPSSKAFVGLGLSFILLQIVNLLKVNAIIGSKCAFFSMSNIILPLIGVWWSLPLVILGFFAKGLVRGLFITETIFTPLAYHIPTICASLYWQVESRLLKILIPLLCMAFFQLHVIGGQAWWYSCYWLIPVFIQFIPQQSLFLKALGSTFTAHAVGSVLWLYWVPMTPAMFWGLMPIVMIERLLYACGLVLVYSLIDWLTAKLSTTSRAIGSVKGSVA
jgi:hypothetical protein